MPWPSPHPAPVSRLEGGLAWAFVAVALAVRVAVALGTDVYFDEAYYWLWSQRLAASYYDHPPLIAWLIALLGIRPTALLCGALTLLFVARLARDVHGTPGAGLWAAALWSTVPAGALAGIWATPDAPLLLFWIVTLWALYHERWLVAGLAAGLALLSKYPAVLLAPAFLIAAAAARRLPRGAWLTAGVAALLFLPVVIWNARRDWVGFAFQLDHGLVGRGGLGSLLHFLLGQLAIAGPVLFVATLVWIARGPRRLLLLRAAAALPLVVFAWAALRTRGEANWPAMAYLSACVGLAGLGRRWRITLAATGVAILLAVSAHLLFPVLRFERDVMLARTHGWRTLEDLVRAEPAFAVLYAPSYQLASEAAYYARVPTDVRGASRKSQFDLWFSPPIASGEDAVWLSEGAPPPDELARRFEALSGPTVMTAEHRGQRVHTFHLWRLRRLRGP